MNPAEAVQAHLDLAAGQSLAMHFGTFQLTPEGIDEPVRELTNALQERSVPPERFRTAEVGESVRLGGNNGTRVPPHLSRGAGSASDDIP
jgi:L-ascorbate metabolism protein UlaG (beta-lactamase superfamily)